MNIQLRQFYGPMDWAWITERIPLTRVQDTCGIVAYDAEDDSRLACVIFDNFTYKTVQAHWIVERPVALRHGLIEKALNFAFETCKKNRIYGIVAENNKKALRLNTRIGFKEVYRIPEGYGPETDYIVMELTDESARHFRDSQQVQSVSPTGEGNR